MHRQQTTQPGHEHDGPKELGKHILGRGLITLRTRGTCSFAPWHQSVEIHTILVGLLPSCLPPLGRLTIGRHDAFRFHKQIQGELGSCHSWLSNTLHSDSFLRSLSRVPSRGIGITLASLIIIMEYSFKEFGSIISLSHFNITWTPALFKLCSPSLRQCNVE